MPTNAAGLFFNTIPNTNTLLKNKYSLLLIHLVNGVRRREVKINISSHIYLKRPFNDKTKIRPFS